MLAYFPQLINISDIYKLNNLVFIVTACCLKNIFIHNFDTFLKVSERNLVSYILFDMVTCRLSFCNPECTIADNARKRAPGSI